MTCILIFLIGIRSLIPICVAFRSSLDNINGAAIFLKAPWVDSNWKSWRGSKNNIRIHRISTFGHQNVMAEKEQLSVSMTTVLTNYHATCYSAAKHAWDVFFLLEVTQICICSWIRRFICNFYVAITGSFSSALA